MEGDAFKFLCQRKGIQKELYDYLVLISKENYTTMTQYIIDLIKKDKNENERNKK